MVVFLYLFFVARWDLASYYLRYALLLALLLVACQKAWWWGAVVLSGALCLAVLGLRRPGANTAIDLAFPLRGPLFCVAHGGASQLLNAHHVSNSQRFALDIVALNWWGARARGVFPARLERYCIFGKTVYSPCSGMVTAVVNGLPDQAPGKMDRSHPAGNHVILRRNGRDIYVGLAHLMNESVVVHAGDSVELGQPLARVGNSGNTSEPHLHIHAKRGGEPTSMLDGEGVPLLFSGRWLVRNSLFK